MIDRPEPRPEEAPRLRHPGAGRGAARAVPKGRQVDAQALAEVRMLLGDAPRRRDLLIEHLHRIQDHFGQISAAHLAALADEMRIALAEAFEVATFYAHFDVVKEGDPAVPPLTLRVCDSLSCALQGAERLYASLAEGGGQALRVLRAPCMGRCDTAPTVEVGRHFVDRATPARVEAAVAATRVEPEIPLYVGYDAYVAAGGYRLLHDLLAGRCSADEILTALDGASLRGLGGAGFPAARKWRAVRGEKGPRLMAVNGDEGEPGTFKDRWYLERDPHRFLEGMLIAARVVEAEEIYVYARDEYPAARCILAAEMARLPAALTSGVTLHLRRGAGAYICGEESALLESIEGKRGLPRHKPPFPFQVGLFGRPTLINNVETLWWVRDLVEKGAAWWKGHGPNGLRSYSVSGRVRQPGMKLAPAGITLRALIDEYCGGMQEGHTLRAYLPGGASGGILPAALDEVPLDFGTLEPYGCFIGSAAVIVLSDQDDLKEAVRNLLRFFEDESCGQCTPCRVGTQKAVALLQARDWDVALLDELSRVMRDASICGLGQAASNPLTSLLRFFPEEFPALGGES
jgi:formate dehydrogenase beta subunit